MTPVDEQAARQSAAAAADRRAPGSLWTASAETLFTIRRSARVGDLITVVVEESASATRGAGTELSKKSETSLGISSFFGAMQKLSKAHPSINPASLLAALSNSSFAGKGSTNRSGTVKATITARIKKVMPNGDYYLEGSKIVMVNNEESHLYISGVVRPFDVQADNTVASGKLADAQVEYTGRGQIADKQRQGWFSKLLDVLNPF